MYKLILPLVLIGALMLSIAGCNDPEQNFGFKPGKHLQLDGPTQITLEPDTTTADTTDRLPSSAEYRIVYATIKNTYKWSVSGNAKIDSTYRYNDQHARITFPAAGTYVVKVEGNIYTGTDTVTVTN